ncbi:MAG: carbohydrate ABC transporter permease [Aristaeellaceae bacterium]
MAATLARRLRSTKWLVYAVLLLAVFITLFPFVWMILSSFKSNVETVQIPPTILPKKWVLDGYQRVLDRDILTSYRNTILVSLGIVLCQLTTASMAAYALARLKFPGRNFIFTLILCMMMVPQNMTLIPKYKIIDAMGFNDSLLGVIIPSFISISVTFFMRQNFLSFPKDLEEAAKIDGCSRVGIFLRILLPLSTSILSCQGVLVLLFAWNDLMWPTIVITNEKYRLLSMFISLCNGQYITDYGFLMAASVLAVMPMIIVYAIFQNSFVTSITMTGIKG